ncbi:hypothetical protein RFEPED_1099 [Rickettsia felis str. Pedreira]|uniref:Uncharacterized protein n=1 Tax=Rickettsia felis str. Pedreira TaxID=1359196 RepID=A0A0F3MTE7_RICFI|nr:hypothetical protein RFEPED_1099 [Rickettsia felis str. Pedreira]
MLRLPRRCYASPRNDVDTYNNKTNKIKIKWNNTMWPL